MKKVCKNCNVEKKLLAFQQEKDGVCRLCKAKKEVERRDKFSSKEHRDDIDLSKYDTIKLFSKNLNKVYDISYEKYKEISNEYNFKTIAEGEVYCTEFMNVFKEDTLSKVMILERDDYRCQYCGNDATTIDHIYPQSLGGADHYINYLTACEACNEAKGDIILEDIFQMRNLLITHKKRQKIKKKERVNWIEIQEAKNKKVNNGKESLNDMILKVFNKGKQNEKWR